MLIRLYQQEDQPQLISILRNNTPTYFAVEEEADFVAYLDHEIESYFVVELADRIVGCAGVNFKGDGSIGVLSWGMVHPDFQGQKIGQALLMHRIAYLKSKSTVQRIEVRTSQLVYRFFEKNGFQLLEIKKDYWAKGLDMYHMSYND